MFFVDCILTNVFVIIDVVVSSVYVSNTHEFNAYIDGIYVIIYMINSTVNPLVYGLSNKEYRRAFLEYLSVSKIEFYLKIWDIS